MLDEDFKVYLIEANTNPCLETTSPLLQKLIPDLVDSGFRLSIDPLYPPPNQNKRVSQQIPTTQWELCYDSQLDDDGMRKLFNDFESKQKKSSEGEEEIDTLKLQQEEADDIYD